MKKTTREFGKCWMCHGAVKDCRLCNGTIQIVIKETIEESDEVSGKAPKVYITDEQLQKLEKELLEDGVENKYCKCCLQSMMSDEKYCSSCLSNKISDDMKEFIEKKCGWELVEKKKEDDCVCPTPLGCYKHWLGNF